MELSHLALTLGGAVLLLGAALVRTPRTGSRKAWRGTIGREPVVLLVLPGLGLMGLGGGIVGLLDGRSPWAAFVAALLVVAGLLLVAVAVLWPRVPRWARPRWLREADPRRGERGRAR